MSGQSHPFSLRLSPALDARVTELAKQSRRSKAAVLESLADEAERCRRYPGLAFRGTDARRRAWVLGTALDVWQVVRAVQDLGGDADRLVRESDLSRQHVQLAMAYHREFREEIDAAIAADRRSVADLRDAYPFLETIELAE